MIYKKFKIFKLLYHFVYDYLLVSLTPLLFALTGWPHNDVLPGMANYKSHLASETMSSRGHNRKKSQAKPFVESSPLSH